VSKETPKGALNNVERESGEGKVISYERAKLSAQFGLGLEENQNQVLLGQLMDSLVAESNLLSSKTVFVRFVSIPTIEKLML